MFKQILSGLLLGDIVEKHISNAPYNIVINTLQDVIKQNGFSIVSVHNMKETFTENNLKISDDFEYRIIQICNPAKSHKALTKMSYDMGVMMPKSIIVAFENGKTTLRFMSMKPMIVSLMFPKLDIAPMSKMVTETMRKIVTETVGQTESLSLSNK